MNFKLQRALAISNDTLNAIAIAITSLSAVAKVMVAVIAVMGSIQLPSSRLR